MLRVGVIGASWGTGLGSVTGAGAGTAGVAGTGTAAALCSSAWAPIGGAGVPTSLGPWGVVLAPWMSRAKDFLVAMGPLLVLWGGWSSDVVIMSEG